MDPEKLGPFKIRRVLGRGGMGAVYEAVSERDGSAVAIKVLTDSLDEDAEDRLRFEAEIETLKRLRHPNIVRLSGFGEEHGQLYYVMELVSGSSLQQELRKKRLFQWTEAAKIGLDVCQALRHAHDRGVIHRDIKPANILFDQEGGIKISDFGIARFFGSQQITDDHTVIGTLEYMSPEQALANPISASSDLYSLGCVLYALLTGKPPFLARSLPELLRKHRNTLPSPIRSVRHDVPENLCYIIADLLLMRPEGRPRNALLVSKRLKSLLQALAGDPATIKVLPLSPDTPRWHLEPIPFPPNGEHPLPLYSRHNVYDSNAHDDDAVDLDKIVKPETEAIPRVVLLPESELSGSFQRIGAGHSPEDARTVALPAAALPAGADVGGTHDPERVDLLADTVTASSVSVSSSAASPQDKPPPLFPDDALEKQPKKLTRFTAVADRSFHLFEEEERSHPVFSLPTVLASIMLIVVGLTVYYLVQPIPPEVLFQRIVATIQEDESAEGPSPASLRAAQSDIARFLDNYPDHTLAEQIQFYQDELYLWESERRLERRVQLHRLSPVERAYVRILATSSLDPEETIVQLRAFIALFQTSSSLLEESAALYRHASGPVEICVELARRRLRKLEQEVKEINTEQEQVLRRRLEAAADLDSTNPARADEIRWGIIELYQHQRWAKKLVEEAQQHLKAENQEPEV